MQRGDEHHAGNTKHNSQLNQAKAPIGSFFARWMRTAPIRLVIPERCLILHDGPTFVNLRYNRASAIPMPDVNSIYLIDSY